MYLLTSLSPNSALSEPQKAPKSLITAIENVLKQNSQNPPINCQGVTNKEPERKGVVSRDPGMGTCYEIMESCIVDTQTPEFGQCNFSLVETVCYSKEKNGIETPSIYGAYFNSKLNCNDTEYKLDYPTGEKLETVTSRLFRENTTGPVTKLKLYPGEVYLKTSRTVIQTGIIQKGEEDFIRYTYP